MPKSKLVLKNRLQNDDAKYDFSEHGYTLPSSQLLSPQNEDGGLQLHGAEDAELLGELRQPEVFEVEHHVYASPFRYPNVVVDHWIDAGADQRTLEQIGLPLQADNGSITIEEEKPIIAVKLVGSGCAANGYNLIEWWNEGETVRKPGKDGVIKRQRMGGLQGRHHGFAQRVIAGELPELNTRDEVEHLFRRMQRHIHAMTANYTVHGSLMSGLYENTVVFRIGDATRSHLTPHKITIRGGCFDYQDPWGGEEDSNRYPADYCFRLIDVLVKVDY